MGLQGIEVIRRSLLTVLAFFSFNLHNYTIYIMYMYLGYLSLAIVA